MDSVFNFVNFNYNCYPADFIRRRRFAREVSMNMKYLLRKTILGFLVVFSLLFFSLSAEALDVYFVRHAETVANVTHNYTEENQRVFSKLGKEQVEELTRQLASFDFDFICVSPTHRTLKTILPYLRIKNASAEIWPEIAECCWQSDRNVKPKAPFQKAEEILLEEQMKGHFHFRDADTDRFYKDGNYADGLVRLRSACDMLIERFSGQDKSVLIVGHSLAGSRIIEMLLGQAPAGKYSPHNAQICYLKETQPGQFRLMRFNMDPSEEILG